MYGSPAGEKRDRILTAADAELDAIAGRIGAGERVTLPYAPLLRLARAIVYPRFRSRVHGEDRTFTVTEACTSCGTCARVCPAENITMVDGRPVWNHRCELCCGCIHLCPVEAIQARKATEGRQRYRNPSVGVAEWSAGGERSAEMRPEPSPALHRIFRRLIAVGVPQGISRPPLIRI